MKSRNTISPDSLRKRSPWLVCSRISLVVLAVLCGCSRIHPIHHETVYVSAVKMPLHDRVAAVSNKVGEVTNGQELEVLEHGRRFLKVKTEKNEIGWIEEHAVIDSKVHDLFTQLAEDHKNDPAVATATLSDDMNLHILPGRDTEHFLLLPANTKVQMLVRASVPKMQAGPGGGHRIAPLVPKPAPKLAPQPAPAATPATGAAASSKAKPAGSTAKTESPLPALPPPPPPIIEDWWLIRDAQGHTGWVLASRLDVVVPDSIAQYAEGQKIVGAYVLTKIHDDDSDAPDHEVPEYVMLLAQPKRGLPYDFDQVRVFTWSVKRHRYETAFRLRPIQGFLPINITTVDGPKGSGKVPAFGVKIGNGNDVAINPETGIVKPASTRTINFEMLDTVVRRIGPDLDPIPSMHSDEDKKDAKLGKKAGKKRR